jgi:histidyl-tRNA synthetase
MGSNGADAAACDVYVLHQGGATYDAALRAAEAVRDVGLDVILQAGEASLKSQMKKADASGAEFALIVGEEEQSTATVTVKPLREGATAVTFGAQIRVPAQEVAQRLVDAFSAEAQDAGR